MRLPLHLSPAFSDDANLVIAYARRGRTWGNMIGPVSMTTLVASPEQYVSRNVVKRARILGEAVSAALTNATTGLPKLVVSDRSPLNTAAKKVPHRKGAGKRLKNVRSRRRAA